MGVEAYRVSLAWNRWLVREIGEGQPAAGHFDDPFLTAPVPPSYIHTGTRALASLWQCCPAL